ncbi:MAG: TatD family hydrolase, partial [Steroidobacteraceae bacterium]
MVKTDGPYLLPRDLPVKPSSRRNEPKYLPHIVEVISKIMNQPFEAVAAASTANALRFFNF